MTISSVRSDRGEVARVVPIETGVFAEFRLAQLLSHVVAEGGEGEQALAKHCDDVARFGVAAVGGN